MRTQSRKRGTLGVTCLSVGGRTLAVVDLPKDADLYQALWQGHGLTEAEVAVGALVLRGFSNAAIAAARRTSPRTVCNQIASLFRKLAVNSRAELAARHPWLGGRPGSESSVGPRPHDG
jgi:DNA-binding CsgD family transcriptional regulator